jgi:hypothetical protein
MALHDFDAVLDLDPAFDFDAYPDPTTQNDADPNPQHRVGVFM